MRVEPIVAEVTVPVTPTEAFVGFTAQMGEWWDPIGRYAQDFWLGHAEEAPTTLDVTFTAVADGTLVHLEHGGWADGSEDVRAKYTHWDDLLRRYASYVS